MLSSAQQLPELRFPAVVIRIQRAAQLQPEHSGPTSPIRRVGQLRGLHHVRAQATRLPRHGLHRPW